MTKPAGRTGLSEVGLDRSRFGTSQKRAALVDQLRRTFDEAAATRSGPGDAYIDLAGQAVRLRFGGQEMSDCLLPALSHLRVQPTPEPALTIHLWDSESSSTAAPVAPWGRDDYREQGRIRGYFGDGFYTVFEWVTRALNVVDREQRAAYFWVRSYQNLGLFERGAPLRTLLNLWLIGQDTQLVHGAAVGRPDGCVMLIGPSGAGKSSTALSCLNSGLGHLGEDYCLVALGDPPVVSSLYNSAKLEPTALSRLPGLDDLVASRPNEDDLDGKALLDLYLSRPEKLILSSPLRAIAVPRIGGRRETTTRRCSAAAALAAVAPSNLLQIPGDGEHGMRWLSDLVTSVPCFELELGSDPSLIPPALEAVLDRRCEP